MSNEIGVQCSPILSVINSQKRFWCESPSQHLE